MSLETTDFVRKPFVVKVIEVTIDNMKEVNDTHHIGSLEEKEDGTPFIAVKTKKADKPFRVFPGYFVVEMGRNVRCFSRKLFFQQFEHYNDGWKAYFEHPEE